MPERRGQIRQLPVTGNDSHELIQGGKISPLHLSRTRFLLGVADHCGVPIPDGEIILLAGQVFFQDNGDVEEIRLACTIDGNPFKTNISPRMEVRASNTGEAEMKLLPADSGRSHVSIVVAKINGSPVHIAAWDWDAEKSLRHDAIAWQHIIWNLIGIPSSLPAQKIREAISKKEFSRIENEDFLIAEIAGKTKPNAGWIRLGPETTAGMSDVEIMKLRREIDILYKDAGDEAADVFDAIMHLWREQAGHEEAYVEISADEILEVRGIEKHKTDRGGRGGYENKQRDKISRCVNLLSNLTILDYSTGSAIGKDGKVSRESDITGSCPAIEVSESEKFRWKVRPGEFIARSIKGKSQQVAAMDIKVLRYNPKSYFWEKRIGKHLTWKWRTDQKHSKRTSTHMVKTLIEDVVQPSEGYLKRKQVVKERFVEAMERLEEDRVIAEFHFDPEIDDTTPDGLRMIPYSDFISRKVVVVIPEEIVKKYPSYSKPKKKKEKKSTAKAPSKIVGDFVKLREERDVVPALAAEILGIDMDTLSQIEMGDISLDGKIREKMKKMIKDWQSENGNNQ